MILLFIFCLYYVLHHRHHKVITPNFLSLSSNTHIQKRQNEYSSSIFSNKSTFVGFSDYRFIICIILLILLSLVAIPIGGLTGFHIFLISQDRTTNEQVTGKYRIQNDLFNRGCWKNICHALCQPLYPRLKPPEIKRYNVDLFEQMAYGKMKYQISKNNHEENGKLNNMTNIHINPLDENGEESLFLKITIDFRIELKHKRVRIFDN